MRKKFAIVLCLTMLTTVMIGGCGRNEPATSQETETDAVETEVTTEENGEATVEFDEWDPAKADSIAIFEEVEDQLGSLPVDIITDGMVIGAIFPEASNEYWRTVAEGIEARAAELGLGTEIQFALTTEDHAGQLSAAETFFEKGLDAFIFSPMTADLFTNITEQIQEQGKPVINAYFTPMENADVFVGAIDAEIGKMAARHTIEILGGEGKVVTVMGAVASLTNQVRCGVFKEYIEANSNIEVVAELPAEWVPETAMQMVQDLLTTTPDVDLIWCANDNLALGAIEGVRSHNALDSIKVMSMDATNAALIAVNDGELYGTFATDPFKVGQVAVEMAVRKMAGQDVSRVVTWEAELVTAENINRFLSE